MKDKGMGRSVLLGWIPPAVVALVVLAVVQLSALSTVCLPPAEVSAARGGETVAYCDCVPDYTECYVAIPTTCSLATDCVGCSDETSGEGCTEPDEEELATEACVIEDEHVCGPKMYQTVCDFSAGSPDAKVCQLDIYTDAGNCTAPGGTESAFVTQCSN